MAAERSLGEYFEGRAEKFKSRELKSALYGLAFIHHAVEGNPKKSLRALAKHVAVKSIVEERTEKVKEHPEDYYKRFLNPALDFKRKFGVLPARHLLRAYLAAVDNRRHLRDLASFLFNHELVRGPVEYFFANPREHRRFLRRLKTLAPREIDEEKLAMGEEILRTARACEIPREFTLADTVYHVSKAKDIEEAIKAIGERVKLGKAIEDFLTKRRVKEISAIHLSGLLRNMELLYAAYHYFKPRK